MIKLESIHQVDQEIIHQMVIIIASKTVIKTTNTTKTTINPTKQMDNPTSNTVVTHVLMVGKTNVIVIT